MQELCETCEPAKALFDKAADVLGYDLLDICINGVARLASAVSSADCYMQRSQRDAGHMPLACDLPVSLSVLEVA